jgi:hypothetical protein
MTMQDNTMYKFLRDGKEELVNPELWRWQAYFNDGSLLEQFDKDGVFHQFKEIDQSKLVAFKMVSPDFSQVYVVPFDPNRMKLIHFYKRFGLGIGTPEFRKITLYCFGYESKGIKHLMVIVPSGEIIMCEDPNIIDVN